ncbi:Solute carrier family 22 member 7, partial [Eschrichtius robustus]|nr:Solute carrier family 22 member 7 [Eschrichtius robustus]
MPRRTALEGYGEPLPALLPQEPETCKAHSLRSQLGSTGVKARIRAETKPRLKGGQDELLSPQPMQEPSLAHGDVWDLVCEQKGLNRATSTFFFAGVLVGAVAFGYLSDRFGRRRLLLVAYVSSLVLGLASAASVSYTMFAITRTLTGTALAGFTIIVMPLELEWLDVGHQVKSWSTALAVMGKGFSEAAFTTAYLFTSELYPTVLSRQTGMGLTALVGRLGGSLAPLAALLDGVWLSLPKLAYGGIALLAACTALLLPETKQAQLPETIQDVERKSAPSNPQEEEMPMKQVQD